MQRPGTSDAVIANQGYTPGSINRADVPPGRMSETRGESLAVTYNQG